LAIGNSHKSLIFGGATPKVGFYLLNS